MDWLQKLTEYFPGLTEEQIGQMRVIMNLYPEWNEKINVISRKDIDNLFQNHVLHSLAIARFLGPLEEGTTFMDLGTGGGFPGIPLAIVYPHCRFHLIDRIGKKLRVAEDVAKNAGIANVTFQHGDSGECHERFNYVVSRAVMPLNDLVAVAARNVAVDQRFENLYVNGIIALKGGDLTEESRGIPYSVLEFDVEEFIPEKCFDTKKLVYIPVIKEPGKPKRKRK